ncbi:MAG: hypothetical protein JWR16_933 [Nevskia sp.]|nr:hypothetical protein [Nevskia sp.]
MNLVNLVIINDGLKTSFLLSNPIHANGLQLVW